MPTVPDGTQPTLFIVGTPLADAAPLSSEAIRSLEKATVIIGESKKVLDRRLKNVPAVSNKSVFFMDPYRREEMEAIQASLRQAREDGAAVALCSDTGMPILFDPGREILEFCRSLGFTIRSSPGPTTWATACAISGYSPPFLLLGFVSQKQAERENDLQKLAASVAHVVLMDTPYRFRSLLNAAKQSFGRTREAFVAWEISSADERFLWGTLEELEQKCESEKLAKGEFVLIVQGKSI